MSFLRKYSPYFVGFTAFLLYMLTIAPSVIQIDAGELATIQIIGGIAHPTGYPLFTIVGYFFSLLPLPFSKIFQMNLLASIYAAAAAGIISAAVRLSLRNYEKFQAVLPVKKSKSKKKESAKQVEPKNFLSEEIILIASASAGIIAAVNKTFWFQSTSVEVYSLHLLLVASIIYFLLKAFIEEPKNNISKGWLFFASALALGFTNHMTTLLILPATAYLFFNQNKFNAASFVKIAKMLALFFPILILFYSYLPIRAAQNPLLNWGNPTTIDRIINHISGKQYQVWLFSSFDSAKKQFAYFASSLATEYGLILALALAGLFYSFKHARKFFWFAFINFAFGVLYSINYDINDIDAYFLLTYIMLSFFSAFGVLFLFKKFESNKNAILIVPAITAVLAAFQIVAVFPKVNQSQNYAYEDYTKALLKHSDKSSLIFSYQWDYFISAGYYFQLVEKLRSDVIIIDKELLRRSWYYNQLAANFPEVMKRIKIESDVFLEYVAPFERDEAYNQNALEQAYRSVMTRLIETNLSDRTLYIGPELIDNEMKQGAFSLPQGYTLVPDIFFFKVVKEGSPYIPASDPDFKIRFAKEKDKYAEFIGNLVGSMLLRRAMYELQFNKIERAKIYVNKIKTDFPEYPIPQGIADAIVK